MINLTTINILWKANFILNLQKRYDKTLKIDNNCTWGLAKDWLEVYENWADRLSNNPRLNEISRLTFSQFYFKINKNQLKIVLKATYGLHPNKYFKILHLIFWGINLVTRRLHLYSNSRGEDDIKGLPISIDFCTRNTEFSLLFSIISPWYKLVRAAKPCELKSCSK